MIDKDFTPAQLAKINDMITARVKGPQHQSSDHLNRGLNPLKITPGTNGQFLHTQGEAGQVDAAWTDRCSSYYAGMYLSGGAPRHSAMTAHQTINAGYGSATWAANFDVRPAGVSAQVDTTTDAGGFRVRKTGIYLITWRIQFSALAVAQWPGCSLFIDGAFGYSNHIPGPGPYNAPIVTETEFVPLTNGNFVELGAWQNDSGDEAYTSGWMRMMYIGPSS
jgi:hypothetical protein